MENSVNRVNNILNKIPNKDEVPYQSIYRTIKYIYKDGDKLIYDLENTSFYNTGKARRRDSLSLYLDKKESILTYLEELVDSSQDIFGYDSFIKNYFNIIDDNLYNKVDFTPISITFNIYAYLKCFHINKSDPTKISGMIDTFKQIINCKDILQDYNFCDENHNKKNRIDLKEKKEILDTLLRLNSKYDIPSLKKYLKDFFEFIGTKDQEIPKISKTVDLIEIIIKDYEDIKDENKDFLFPDAIITEIINNSQKDNSEEIYYCKSALFKNRFTYLNEKLNKHISNKFLREEFANVLKQIDYQFFQTLETENEKEDNFVTYLNIIFNSDTYGELDKRLGVLNDAYSAYKNRDLDIAKNMISLLNDSSLNWKKRLAGSEVSTNTELSYKKFSNKVDKPDNILERTIELYEYFYGQDDEAVQYISELNQSQTTFYKFQIDIDDVYIEKENEEERKTIDLAEQRESKQTKFKGLFNRKDKKY